MSTIEEIKKILKNSANTVFFGGAGVSTDSGIPDFRGSNGLYMVSQEDQEDEPEYLLSHTCLVFQPEKFFRYYRDHMLYPNAKPNFTHYALAQMEREGRLKAVITQNIDGLHQLAGSQNVLELHGTTKRNYCSKCGKIFDADFIAGCRGIPRCSCGGIVRPDVVLYEEGLNSEVLTKSANAIAGAEVLIVGGTSLTVHPAASLVEWFTGRHLILINLSETPYDGMAEYVIREPLSEVFRQLV
ncbi:MAG: NAD-dependent protein deacylase [Eubacteriales bacterium]